MTTFAKIVTKQTPSTLRPATEGKTGTLVAEYVDGTRAIIKPVKEILPNGKKRQRGLLASTIPMREVAFYRLAQLLGYEDLVPETVLTDTALIGVTCSAQQYVPAFHLKRVCPRLKDVESGSWSDWLIKASSVVPKSYWRRLLALDVIAGARDRHANNVGLSLSVDDNRPIYRIVAWDNGATFGTTFDRYHNVFHKFLFRTSVNWEDVWPVVSKIKFKDLQNTLGDLLNPLEISHAYLRLQFFLDYPYRLPWRVCSKGHDNSNEFPHYDDYFKPATSNHVAKVAV